MIGFDNLMARIYGLFPRNVDRRSMVKTTKIDDKHENDVIMFDFLQKKAKNGKLGIPVK